MSIQYRFHSYCLSSADQLNVGNPNHALSHKWESDRGYHFIYLAESQYHFHGSVMKIAEPGFEVEFATKFKFAAQLFFVLTICVKF